LYCFGDFNVIFSGLLPVSLLVILQDKNYAPKEVVISLWINSAIKPSHFSSLSASQPKTVNAAPRKISAFLPPVFSQSHIEHPCARFMMWLSSMRGMGQPGTLLPGPQEGTNIARCSKASNA
jgi:hypothetical protein